MNEHGGGKRPRNIRSQNRRLILDLYRTEGSISAGFIAEKVKLSRTTVMKINSELLKKCIITESGKGESTDEGGKKPILHRLNSRNQMILTFHIKYESIIFQLSDLSITSIIRDEIAISRNSGFSDIIVKMQELLEKHELMPAKHPVPYLACMVAVHGDVDSETGICIHSTYFPSWGTYNNLKEKLDIGLGLTCPIYVDSWIRIKAYGENRTGLARGHDSVVLIDAGWHGVTAGILIDGKIFTGRNSLSGEIGHLCLDSESRVPCACGSKGCFEALISIQTFLDRISKEKKQPMTLNDAFKAADSGNRIIRESLDNIIKLFAMAISHIILFFDPEIIIIEGDYSSGCEYLETGIINLVEVLSLPRIKREVPLVFNNRNSVDTLKGASILAMDNYFQF
ncbi:MAG: ROK family protein [Spirochaetes bacterium]|nr:MAG: ROK family protein [Spirochaetota bacterium]